MNAITKIFPNLPKDNSKTSIDNSIHLFTNMIKLKKETRNKLMELNQNYLLNYLSMCGAFIFGLETRLKNR